MSFTEFADYAIVADLRVGSNGATPGIPELAVGSSPDDQSDGRFQWDLNSSNGFDSGWVPFALTINANGGAGSVELSIDNGATTVFYTGNPFGEILSFSLRAGVDGANDTVSFRNISVKFFSSASASVPSETDETDDIAATTVGTQNTEDESIVEIGPEGSGFKKAVFLAQVRMQSPSLPDPNELFGQIFVFATSA